MRILAIDYGRKRVGLALSDPLGMTAQPKGYMDGGKALCTKLKAFIEEWNVQKIIIGYPISLNGTAGPMAQEASAFVEDLKKQTDVSIEMVDERFSTAEAERLLIEGEVRRDKRKEVRDSIAAAILLQTYLERTQRRDF